MLTILELDEKFSIMYTVKIALRKVLKIYDFMGYEGF